jgi:hypothetical protein
MGLLDTFYLYFIMVKVSFAHSNDLMEIRRMLEDVDGQVDYANFAHYRFIMDTQEEFCELLREFSRTWDAMSMHACSTITDEFLVHSLFALQGSLRSLDLSSCKLSDHSVFAICHSLHSSTITTIKLGSSSVTDASLVELAEECPSLSEVHLAGCSQITDEGIIFALIAKSKQRHVPFTVLMLSACKKITNRALRYLAEAQGEYLERLSFSFCFKLTDSSISLLAESARNLVAINLCGCKVVGDESVLSLLKNCPLLSSISVNSCKRVSAAPLQYVIQRRQPEVTIPLALHFIDVRGCTLLEEDPNLPQYLGEIASLNDPYVIIKCAVRSI